MGARVLINGTRYKSIKKKKKRRGPYDPYPGWAAPIPDEEFYRQIAGGPVAFTRPATVEPQTKTPKKDQK
jgi:hypothetical protein